MQVDSRGGTAKWIISQEYFRIAIFRSFIKKKFPHKQNCKIHVCNSSWIIEEKDILVKCYLVYSDFLKI